MDEGKQLVNARALPQEGQPPPYWDNVLCLARCRGLDSQARVTAAGRRHTAAEGRALPAMPLFSAPCAAFVRLEIHFRERTGRGVGKIHEALSKAVAADGAVRCGGK